MGTRELFERYGDAVFRLAWSCTGSRQDAEDVTQTVFLKVLERRPDPGAGKGAGLAVPGGGERVPRLCGG